MRQRRRTGRWVLLVSVFLVVVGCGKVTGTGSYTAGPVKFSVDTYGEVSVALGRDFVTPMGVFSVSGSTGLTAKKDFIVIFRDSRRLAPHIDQVFKVKAQDHVIAVVDGLTTLDIGSRRVIVDTSGGNVHQLDIGRSDRIQPSGLSVAPTTALTATTTVSRTVLTTETTSPPQARLLDITDDRMVGSAGGMSCCFPLSINGKRLASAAFLGLNYCDLPACSGYIDLNLSREFRTLTARVGIADDSIDAGVSSVQFVADGEVLHEGSFRFGESEDVKLDVTGVLRLRISMTAPYRVRMGVGDPVAVR